MRIWVEFLRGPVTIGDRWISTLARPDSETHMGSTSTLFVVAALLGAPMTAYANCQISPGTILGCDEARNDSVADDAWSSIINGLGSALGLADPQVYSGCGPRIDYDEPQDYFLFICQNGSPDTSITISNMNCDLDLFVLDDSCNSGSSSSCLDGSIRAGTNPDTVNFSCDDAETYFIAVERYDRSATPGWLGGSCTIYENFNYRITTDCVEICDDFVDNDDDGLEDCLDQPECGPCVEDCDDGFDNDYDNKVDCDDEDCIDAAVCCDNDGDNFQSVDGICGGDDCNDNPLTGGAAINPGATEAPVDELDQNCDGFELCYLDEDGDFYGVPVLVPSGIFTCQAEGVADNDLDCDDSNPEVNPGVPEIIGNGQDDNCDGLEFCYLDSDTDGFGSTDYEETPDVTCSSPSFATNFDDCDDSDPAVYPGALELPVSGADEDCDGLELCFEDRDGDGVGRDVTVETANVTCIGTGVSLQNDDCNDEPGIGSTIFPSAIEGVADGIDQDCNGLEECWVDADFDLYGNNENLTTESTALDCIGSGISDRNDDCNDSNGSIHPDAPDPAGDGIDQNCDDLQACYVDADGDGFGGDDIVLSASPGCVEPFVSEVTGDCDDTQPSINPTATETPTDGIDQNCDGLESCFTDADGDTFGSDIPQNSPDLTCASAGVSINSLDCLDVGPNAASVNPNAVEIPNNGVDEDCNGQEECYEDQDGDGYGGSTLIPSFSLDCSIGGASDNNDDCDDSLTGYTINPGATEVPANNIDENCDGEEECFLDLDGDNFGIDSTVPTTDLTCLVTADLTNNNNDCDDNRPDVYPGAPQGGDPGVDYDCSGFTYCYIDSDNDGFGGQTAVNSSDPLCGLPGVSDNNYDCNDQDQAINPNATETPNNGVDENCDNAESCYLDFDGDNFGSINLTPSEDLSCNASGVSSQPTDCDDYTATVFPGAQETPANLTDENCDGQERCYIDIDNDTYGRSTTTLSTDLTCQSTGIADNDDDCNDTNATVNPGQVEIPLNGIDDDCDGNDNCYQDLDGDGFGSTIEIPSSSASCTGPGVSPIGTDCNDAVGVGENIYPGAPEIPGSGIDENCDGLEDCFIDNDGDNYGGPITQQSVVLTCVLPGASSNGDDCNDAETAINPGAAELPADGIDQNCDGLEACYVDADSDTYGSAVIEEISTLTCLAAGYSVNDDDCFDLPPEGASIYPGAPETPADGIDSDCDGSEFCYEDLDNDGHGRDSFVASLFTNCNTTGVATTNDDCDDSPATGANVYPGAPETPADGIDQNCDTLEDCYVDADADAYGTSIITSSNIFTCIASGIANNPDDCNDVPPAGFGINPGATEIPGNGIDENCDGGELCYEDQDFDGFGGTQTAGSATLSCDAPGTTTVPGDCDDTVASIYPNAPEIPADGIDQDCDAVDDCYQDFDQDGYGSEIIIPGTNLSCSGPIESPVSTDCLDIGSINGVISADINPAAIELCNEVDDDCDGDIDDGDSSLQSNFTWYFDNDGDGYGNISQMLALCNQPDGYVAPGTDCDDANAAINPGADEVCDPLDIDENCNLVSDEDDPDVTDATIYHPDFDGDGYGNSDPNENTLLCEPLPLYSLDNTDCDDGSALSNPGLSEVPYDGLDNDCDETTLDDDLDQDGYDHTVDCNDVPPYGTTMNPGTAESPAPNFIDDDCDGFTDEGTINFDDDGDGFSETGGDCDDADPSQYPNAVEQPNGVDDNCNGIVDENTSLYDDDGDGYSDANDCDDYNPLMNPGRSEIPDNGIDDDCDGIVDSGGYDLDQDGYAPSGGDCDDNRADVHPYAPEVADGVDNDCDGMIDEGTTTSDDDGDGQSEDAGDCDDTNPDVNTSAVEVNNGIDDNCDGIIDNNTTNSDDDLDGFAENQGDCDDQNSEIYPGAEEVANNLDDDCDGFVDEGTVDADEDGYTVASGDCDDNNGWVNPGLSEACDGLDNDCDGRVDEDCVGTLVDTGALAPADPGCGCSSSNSTAPGWLLIPLLMLGLARRRDDKAA